MAEKRIAVVTGGNRGLGLATSEALAKDEYKVILTSRTEEKAAQAAGTLRDKGLDVVGRVLDVSDDASVDAFFDGLKEEFGRIDVLVNNAGALFDDDGPNEAHSFDASAATLAQAFNNNSLSAYRTMQRAVPMMNAAGYGRVVNVSSGMGGLVEMGSGHPAYRVSKTALNGITRVFHHEAQGNVKINAVCPGWVRTEMGGSNASRGIDEGIAGIVWAATLPDDGPNGGFFRDGKEIQW